MLLLMKRVFCLLRGGHQPMRRSLSMTRIFCSRCGRELQYVAPQPPPQPEEVHTTIKPRRYATLRPFGRLAQPVCGTSELRPGHEERPQQELP
jgi:hypothetical protein